MTGIVSHLLRRFELYLAGTTVVLFVVVAAMILADHPPLYVGAVSWISLLVLQIAIQTVDRERQRRLRAMAIHDIREMLTDRVLNPLATIKVWAAMTTDSTELTGIVADVDASIDEVAAMVTSLSEEQLDTWQLRYAHSDAHRFQSDAMFV
jgi:hypothetical protein